MAGRESYDLVVIGAGPGGYVACLRAAQLGLKVACVEKNKRLGGVCLNVGCIPSKALLDSSEYFYLAKNRLAEHGIRTGQLELDLAATMARKDQVVEDLTHSVRKLLEGRKVKIFHGSGRLLDEHTVEVRADAEGLADAKALQLTGDRVLLATGSEPIEIPTAPFDGKRIVSSTEALSFDAVPEHLAIVGGGYIGLELGSLWNRLGAAVTVIEMMPKIATVLDGQITRSLQRILAGQGLSFKLKTKVLGAEVRDERVVLTLESDQQNDEMTCDRLLVATGRRPLTRGLNLDQVGVKIEVKTGQVLVDHTYRTNIGSIYAIGDLTAGPMLAHKASAEAVAAVEGIAGLTGAVNYDVIPSVIYTSPEVAGVGLTEEQVKERGIDYCVGSCPFSGVARARCMGRTEGLVKVIAHSRTDRILGIHIIGARASEIIAECALALEFGASSEDIARTIHAHPTFAEALREAALSVQECPSYAS